jgi:hypothetical protein
MLSLEWLDRLTVTAALSVSASGLVFRFEFRFDNRLFHIQGARSGLFEKTALPNAKKRRLSKAASQRSCGPRGPKRFIGREKDF